MATHSQRIDWAEQWELHAPGFEAGKLPLPGLPSLFLEAGAGFGDLSHPTTQLVYSQLPSFVKEKCVLDIGCGSGILSVAALGHGASFAYGIDIDQEAIEHAKANASRNGFDSRSWFGRASTCPLKVPCIGLMNMIRTEQEEAWKSIESLHPHITHLLTSGVLKEERETYLKQVSQWGFRCEASYASGEWFAFLFIRFYSL